MKSYWLETTGSIEKGVGFSQFSLLHLGWLGFFLLFSVGMCAVYRKLDSKKRKTARYVISGAIVADELFKMAVLFIGGHYTKNYLPLHLCSINIFLIAYHAWKPSHVLSNFLYAVCIPGALAALLFPGWTKLPLANFMHIHSFTIHILLVVYPLMLLAAGEIRPDWRTIPRLIGILGAFALVALAVNLLLDTNYMFLMYAPKNNPLYLFEKAFGNHLVGFAVIMPCVLALMYLPYAHLRRHKAVSLKHA